MDIKHYIYTWDKDKYVNRTQAQVADALTKREIVLPDRLINRQEKQAYVRDFFNSYVLALNDSGTVFVGDSSRIGYELVRLEPHSVSAEVLEWNRYTVTIYAEDAASALAQAKEDGVVSCSPDDVESGIRGYEGDAPSQMFEEVNNH